MLRNTAWAAGAGEGPAAHCVCVCGMLVPGHLPVDREGRRMQFGRYFEEFEVGDVYRHWPGKTVTEADDHLFCLLTMNHHPLHLDAHYAETSTQFKRKAIANLEVESLRHTAPTFHGDTIYGVTTVLDRRESESKPDRGVVTVETRGYKQDGTLICVFRRRVMVPKKEYAGPELPSFPTPVSE